MKIRQNIRHWAAKRALTTPVIGRIMRDKLVDLHTRIFLKRADDAHAEDRRDHLDAFFAATMDTYVAALDAGYSEANAREITHIQANFDFYNHGWVEMMEFPPDELDQHHERYAEFFSTHNISIEDPLGDFKPDRMPQAPSTPGKLEVKEHPYAEGGFADDVYVERDGDIVVGGSTEPDDVDLTDAPGLSTSEGSESPPKESS